MPNLVEWNSCCGCGSCANKCPKNAISMSPNKEGFLHPEIDKNLCVECGACEKVCPGLEPAKNTDNNPKAFIVQHKNDVVRFQSTSGGAFTAIAEEIIKRNGVVYGAAMTDELTVKHICVDTVEGLAQFRNSKYVQSEIGSCYKDAKAKLDYGITVCFSGTPCQINGLYKYLGKDYENMIAVDIVCKSVPSPLVFQKYVEYKKEQEGSISDVVFRDKKRGFLYCTMAHYASHSDRLKSKDIYRRGSESDEWLRLFLSGRISRHSCSECQYQDSERKSDFTLGDIWETSIPSFNDNKGTTLIHVWTQKGLSFFESIQSNVKWEEYPVQKGKALERKNTVFIRPDREILFSEANQLSPQAFFSKYAPYSLKVKLKQFGRYMVWRLHIHNLIRHIKHMS